MVFAVFVSAGRQTRFLSGDGFFLSFFLSFDLSSWKHLEVSKSLRSSIWENYQSLPRQE